MEHLIRIEEIEKRAEKLGLSLLRLCRVAETPYSSVHRWKTAGDANPQLRGYRGVLGKLVAELERRERELLIDLCRLHPDVAAGALQSAA
jgi:predicted transcriptional regulator